MLPIIEHDDYEDVIPMTDEERAAMIAYRPPRSYERSE